jgi:hypothetical protein
MLRSRIAVLPLATLAAGLLAACGSAHTSSTINPPGGAAGGGSAQTMRAAGRFSACMRAHGVADFPDPTQGRAFKLALAPGGAHAPAFAAAQSACQHLLPPAPAESAAEGHAHVVAGLAFAGCMRTHGFPSFPDPSSTGQLSHEMLAAAGIDIHQPAAGRAADLCAGVTHGLITPAIVARFIAGQ